MPTLDFLRRTRRLSGWLLLGVWLALLPLRGWAETAMHPGLPAPATPQALAAVMPCHGAMPQAAHALQTASSTGSDEEAVLADGAGGDTGGDTSSTCALCVLCHAPALPVREAHLAPGQATASDGMLPARGHAPPALPLPERPPRS